MSAKKRGPGTLNAGAAFPGTPRRILGAANTGFLFTAAAFVLMSATVRFPSQTERANPLWLIGFYVLLSVGELLLSPMGLSLVTGLASPRRAARMVGWWYAAVAAGYWLGGQLGWLWARWSHHRYFALIAVLLILAAAVLLSRLRSLDAAFPGSRPTASG